jgi:hypothetical protein
MPYEGSPGLWPVILMPFAKLDFPIATASFLNWIFIVGAGALVWFRSPLPLIVRIPFLFSYFVVYDFAVIARNYAMATFLLFAVMALYPSRFRRPYLFSVTIILFMNTNVFGTILGSILGFIFFLDLMLGKHSAKLRFTSTAILFLGVALAGAQLIPSDKGGSANEILGAQITMTIVQGLERFFPWTHLLGSTGCELFLLLLFVALVAFIASLSSHPRALFFFLCSLPFPMMLFSKIYFSRQYFGFVVMGTVAAAWLARVEGPRNLKWLPGFLKDERWHLRLESLSCYTLGAVLMLSDVFGITELAREYRQSFSGAREMADYIKSNRLDHLKIAVFMDGWGTPLAPHLPGVKFYYLGAQRYGTYIIQDPTHRRGDLTPWDVAIQRAFNEMAATPRFLLLTNFKLNVSAFPNHFKFLHEVTKPKVIWDEEYFLYECYPMGNANQ